MSESALSLKYSDLMAEVGRFLGYSGDAATWPSDKQAEIDRYVQSGVRQFYYPPAIEGIETGYEWSFLNPTTTISTAIGDQAQDLPDDHGRILGNIHFASSVCTTPIVMVSEHQMLVLGQRDADRGRPSYATVRYKDGTTADEGQRLEIVWWRIPDAVYALTYRYEAYAGKLSSLRPYPLGGMKHSETIMESCLAVAEQRANDEKGLHWGQFVSLLATSIALDRKVGARYFGQMGSPEAVSYQDELSRHSNGLITYKGVTW